MPSYFFHLKLELYPSPAQSTHKSRRSVTPPSKTNHTFLPSRSADIFHTPLPAHKTSRWSSYTFPKYPPTTDASPASGSDFTNSPRRQPPTDTPESHGDALLLPERSLNLQHVPHSPALTPVKVSKEVSAKDWRYSAVSIESIDMELQGGSELRSGSSPVAASKTSQAKNTNGGLHTKALYLPSDPKTTEVGWGVVHLYRDAEETNLTEDKVQKQKRLGNSTQLQEDKDFDPEDCTTLCILAVPSWMMPSDLLGFVGDQAREDVSHFRLIRTGRANKYMVLLKFRTARKARDWQKMYNGRLFSAAEPENCHVVFIKSVEFLGPDEADVGSFPQNANDPFTPAARSGSGSKSLSSKPLAPPPPNLLELPTCPVCLERMDETTGLLTILCQHVFHCACLEKWRGSGCPVCRYTHSPSYTFPYPRPYGNNGDDDGEPMCSVCAATSNIWVCLICGNLGCGRYDSAHAYAHYEETSHCYAMDISTQHVWDYAGDGWVHRLIQSKPDTHLIDLPSRQRHENEAFRSEGGDSVPREKMESMAAEYTYLLTSQLEGQRRYFEEQVERAVDKASQASARADEAASHAEKAAQTASHHQQSHDDASAALAKAEKALEKSERAREKFEKLARDMSSQLREEKTMNEGLLKRIRAADEKAESAKKAADEAVEEKKELQDMVNDLTMFISSQEKVKELQAAGEEVVEGGDSGVVEGPKKKNKGKGRKK